MKKKILPFVFLLLLGAALTVDSIDKWINDVNVDLSKSLKYRGEVIYSGIHTIKASEIPGKYAKPAFLIRFTGRENFFGVYRPYHGYQDLAQAINRGDTIVIYFRSSKGRYNLRVFQIEKGDKVIAGYGEYNEAIGKRAGLELFVGLVIIIVSLLWFKNIDLIRFLNRLVEPVAIFGLPRNL